MRTAFRKGQEFALRSLGFDTLLLSGNVVLWTQIIEARAK